MVYHLWSLEERMASYTKVGNGKASGLPTGKLTDRQRCGYAAKTKVWLFWQNLIENKNFSMTSLILKESNKKEQWQQQMQQTKNLMSEKIKILLISRCHHQKRLLYQRSKSRRISDLCHSRYIFQPKRTRLSDQNHYWIHLVHAPISIWWWISTKQLGCPTIICYWTFQ